MAYNIVFPRAYNDAILDIVELYLCCNVNYMIIRCWQYKAHGNSLLEWPIAMPYFNGLWQ